MQCGLMTRPFPFSPQDFLKLLQGRESDGMMDATYPGTPGAGDRSAVLAYDGNKEIRINIPPDPQTDHKTTLPHHENGEMSTNSGKGILCSPKG
jgi:hypothetical protein